MTSHEHFGQEGVCWRRRASLWAPPKSQGTRPSRAAPAFPSNLASPSHDILSGRKENKTDKGGWERRCAGGRGGAAPLLSHAAPWLRETGWAGVMLVGGWVAGLFAGWVSKGRLTGEGSTMSSVTGSNVTQRHLLSTTTTSAASSLCKSGA